MNPETLGWVLVIVPLAIVWGIALMLDWYDGLLVIFASLAAGAIAGSMAYGLYLTGVVS